MNRSSLSVVQQLSLLGVIGGAIMTVGAAVTYFVTSDVSSDLINAPYSRSTFVMTESLWGICHGLAAAAFYGFLRSGLAGPGALARWGNRLALVGLAAMLPLEFAYALATGKTEDDTYVVVVGSVFGLAAVLVGIGMVLNGIATARSGGWTGWRRYLPLACGLYTFLVLIPLTFTRIDMFGISGFSFIFLLLAWAVFTRPQPEPTAIRSVRPAIA